MLVLRLAQSWLPSSPLAATDAVAVGVTVLSTLLLLGLVGAVSYLLRVVHELRREARELSLESRRLLGELDQTVRQAGREIERVDRMVGSAEAITEAVGSASHLVGGVVTKPLIKVVAFASGVARGVRHLQAGPSHVAAKAPPARRRGRREVPERPLGGLERSVGTKALTAAGPKAGSKLDAKTAP
ncbi:MAG: hypothetical protein ACP5VR_04445, partial [Acidimicrobiales bacterium]